MDATFLLLLVEIEQILVHIHDNNLLWRSHVHTFYFIGNKIFLNERGLFCLQVNDSHLANLTADHQLWWIAILQIDERVYASLFFKAFDLFRIDSADLLEIVANVVKHDLSVFRRHHHGVKVIRKSKCGYSTLLSAQAVQFRVQN